MKKSLLFIAALIASSCKNVNETRYFYEKQALESGIHVDTIFKDIAFNESPIVFRDKIERLKDAGYESLSQFNTSLNL